MIKEYLLQNTIWSSFEITFNSASRTIRPQRSLKRRGASVKILEIRLILMKEQDTPLNRGVKVKRKLEMVFTPPSVKRGRWGSCPNLFSSVFNVNFIKSNYTNSHFYILLLHLLIEFSKISYSLFSTLLILYIFRVCGCGL